MNHAVVYKIPLTRTELLEHLKANVFTDAKQAVKGKLGTAARDRLI